MGTRRSGPHGIAEIGRPERGRAAQRRGIEAEARCCAALEREGWTVLLRRARTPAGEIDIVAEQGSLLAFIEVKARRSLAEAAVALSVAQRARLIAAAEILLAAQPGWTHAAIRFDLMVVASDGQVRRIPDAFRIES